MKTAVEISDPLLRAARKRAAADGVTFRALVERGLRNIVLEAAEQPPFKLRRALRGPRAQPEPA
ncbi:MAG TPA: hypothetical protein VHC94_17050 [Nitrobacter sp.]|nr:hypothetical protein [Nitrobacter sp.]